MVDRAGLWAAALALGAAVLHALIRVALWLRSKE